MTDSYCSLQHIALFTPIINHVYISQQKEQDLFRERMAKLVRAEDIMQQKVKRIMLYKDAMLAQIKSQVSHDQTLQNHQLVRCVKQFMPRYASNH